MRALSETLAAAQKSASSQPYVKAVFSDYFGDVSRQRFSRLYTGSEPAGFVACCQPGDGVLVRARIDPGTATLYTVAGERVRPTFALAI